MMIPPTSKGSKIPPIWKEPRLWYRLLQIRYGAWDMNRTQFVHLWKTLFNCRKRNFDIAHPRHRLDFHDPESSAPGGQHLPAYRPGKIICSPAIFLVEPAFSVSVRKSMRRIIRLLGGIMGHQ